MQKGIFNWFGFLDPIEVRLEQIKESGFSHVALWWEDETWPKTVKRFDMVRMAEAADLTVDSIHLPYLEINDIWQEDNRKSTESYQNYLMEIASSGGKLCVLHLQNEWYEPETLEPGYRFIEGMVTLAEQLNLKIALENTHHTHLVSEALRLFPSKKLGICYDSSHDFFSTETHGALLKKHSERLFCLHLSDTDGLEDRHWTPGPGIVDFSMLNEEFRLAGYQGIRTLEVIANERQKELGAEAFLTEAYRSLDLLMSKI